MNLSRSPLMPYGLRSHACLLTRRRRRPTVMSNRAEKMCRHILTPLIVYTHAARSETPAAQGQDPRWSRPTMRWPDPDGLRSARPDEVDALGEDVSRLSCVLAGGAGE